ncbi:MAG: flagellar basal body P-ring protein FlgI [Pseudomonadota bacterium]
MLFGRLIILFLLWSTAFAVPPSNAQSTEIRTLGRFDGWRDNNLVGYGLVVGLAGSGDTRQSAITRQAVRNVLGRLGTTVTEDEVNSRNVAVVMVMGTLPPSANRGDRIPATVSSVGDARSLAGGSLLMTPLAGPDGNTYALAQGSLVTGGYSFEDEFNLQQRNFPTTARLENGATVEVSVDADLVQEGEELRFLLKDADFGMAASISEQINTYFGQSVAWAKGADEVRIAYAGGPRQLAAFVGEIERIAVGTDTPPRIVINERTGTIVAGSSVTLSSVVIAQGDIRITVTTENTALQPAFISGINPGISSLIITNTELDVEQGDADVVATFDNSSIADLVQGLSQAGVDTRRTIGILQSLKDAGALHADIIVQ